MQTFLCYPNFADSARVLDDKRLGKQRVECLQILQTLQKRPYDCSQCKRSVESCLCIDPITKIKSVDVKPWLRRKTPWYNHPAVRMWRGYERALAEYGSEIVYAWLDRGFRDTTLARLALYYDKSSPLNYPPWLGDSNFHASHRSNLLRKMPEHYQQFCWIEPNNLPYVWPV